MQGFFGSEKKNFCVVMGRTVLKPRKKKENFGDVVKETVRIMLYFRVFLIIFLIIFLFFILF